MGVLAGRAQRGATRVRGGAGARSLAVDLARVAAAKSEPQRPEQGGQVEAERPQPVIPALILWRSIQPGTRRRNSSTKLGRSGRAPTSLIMPGRTLKNWGSFSRRHRRSNAPTCVRRGSPGVAAPAGRRSCPSG
jgi:hypothetical protein